MLDQNKKDEIRAKIEAELIETEKKIADLEELSKPIPPENSLGRITRMDAINNASVAKAALREAKRKYGKLKHALSKIDEPDYGLCSNCKHPIPEGRLMLMPESTRCVRCADR